MGGGSGLSPQDAKAELPHSPGHSDGGVDRALAVAVRRVAARRERALVWKNRNQAIALESLPNHLPRKTQGRKLRELSVTTFWTFTTSSRDPSLGVTETG